MKKPVQVFWTGFYYNAFSPILQGSALISPQFLPEFPLLPFFQPDHQGGAVISGPLWTVGNQIPSQFLGTALVKFDQGSPKELARDLITHSPQGATDDSTALVIRLEKRE